MNFTTDGENLYCNNEDRMIEYALRRDPAQPGGALRAFSEGEPSAFGKFLHRLAVLG